MNPEELQQAIESFKAAMEMLPASMQNTVERLNETVELLNQTNDKLKKTAETASGTKPKAEAATGGGASRQSQDFRRSADSLQKIYEELKKAKQEKKTEVTLNPEQLKALNLNKEQQRKLKIDDKRNPYLNVKVDTSKLEKILKETEKVKLQSVEEFRYFSDRFTSLGSVVKEGTRIFQDNNKANLGLISTTTLMTAAFTGAKDAVTGYIKSVMDGQRGASVSAKALTDFTSSVTTAAKGISYAMLFIPGLGLGLKALALGVGLASEAVDLAAKVNEMGAKQADNLFAAFNELGKAGASGSKGIMGVYENLQDLGYSTNEVAKYQSLVVSNSKDLAMFGPTVSQGANKFVEVAKEISGQGKELGKRFQALGITSEEQNEHILKYMGLQAKQGTLQGRTTEELRKGAAAYIEELDTMARLTGASRKEIEQQREAAASDEQLQAALFEAEGDPERTKEIEEAIKTVANLRQLGKDVEATGIAKMVAGRGALGFKEAQTLAMQGITYEGLKGAGGAEAQTRMVVAAGGQMARRVGSTGTLTGELAGAGNMMGSGFYRQRVAEGGLKFVDGKIVKAEEAAAAAKGEQQQMMNQTEPVTKALIDGMDKQRELALTIDRSLKDTFLNAVNINKTASEAVAKAAKEFESGMKYLKSLKALGIEGPADFALKGTMIVAVASAVLSFLATKQLGKVLGGALEGLKGGAAGAARGAAGAASGAAAGAGGFARGTGRAARAGRAAGGLGAGPRVGGGFAGRAATGAADAASGLSTVAGKQGPSMGSKLTDLGEGVGGLVGGILKGVGTGGGVLIEAVLTGLAKGIAAMANPMFVLGAGALGLAITAIGAGIAGAAWIMGKALPTFAEGLKSFSDIDGENLKDVGLGVTALGAGLAVFGAGGLASSFANVASNVIDGLVGFFGGKTPFDKIKEFSKLDIDGPKLKVNAEALKVFAEAMTALSGSGATITGTIAEGLSRFFEVKTPWDKFIEFSKLPIKDSSKVETNAKALAAFASAISLLKGNVTFSEVAMDSVSKFFNLQTPWDKFVQFSRVDLGDSDRITKNANALKAFNDAMSGYKGAGSGFGAWLGNFDALNVDFAKIGERIRSFVGEFESLPLGSKDRIIIASEVLKAFDDSVGSFKGAGAGVGAALNNIDWLNVDFSKINSQMVSFSKIDAKKDRIVATADALKAFDDAMSSYKGAGAGIGAWLNNIGKLNVDLPQVEKRMKDFSKIDVKKEDIVPKAEALKAFDEALSSYSGAGSGVGAWLSNFDSLNVDFKKLAARVTSFLVEFSSFDSESKDRIIANTDVLKAFDQALGSYQGAGSGVGAWLSNMVPAMSFDIGLLKTKIEKFNSIKVDQKTVVANATALKAFDEALSSYKGAGAGAKTWLSNIAEMFGAGIDLNNIAKKMLAFSKIKVEGSIEDFKLKAEGFKAFAQGIEAFSNTKVTKGSTVATTVADNLSKKYDGKTIVDKFEEFAGLKIDQANFNKNTELFQKFINSMGFPESKGFVGTRPSESKPSGTTPSREVRPGDTPSTATPPVSQDVKQNLADITAALQKRGMTDQKYINAVLGNVMKETGGKAVEENLDYSRTDNSRIREIFGERAAGKSDEELNRIKSSKEGMGEMMYGANTKIGRSMGNMEPGDGWKYRGRGYIQLTGKNNYSEASKALFGDDRLLKNPDLVNDPRIAPEVTAWFMSRGKKQMANKLGINPESMTQKEADLLATSQVAGRAITPGSGFLGNEALGKVSSYSAKMGDITGGSPKVASAGSSTVSSIASEEILKKHGLRIKKGDVQKEGAELDPRMLDLASQIQQTIPGFNVFTGFNDQFHNEKAPKSLHAKGKAVDFTVAKPPTKEEGQEIVRALNGMGFAHAIDEYNNPSRQSTGGHFHAQLQAKNGGMFEGPKSGYAVQLHGKEAVLPMTNPQVTKESLSKLFADMEWGKSNTIADKLEQVLTQIRSSSTNITPTSNDDLVMQLLEKVDTMIDVLESSRRIQDTQLRHLRA